MIQETNLYNIEQKILQATERKEKQDFDSVRNIYQELVALQPNNPSFYDELAQSQACLGLFPEAINNYRKSIELGNENKFWIYKNLGDSLAEVKEIDEAVNAYRKALEIEPDRATVLNKLAKLESQQPDLNPNLDSTWLEIHNRGDEYFLKKEWSQALSLYQQAIELNPNYFWSWYNLGRALSKLQRWNDSTNALAKSLEQKPNSADAHSYLGKAQSGLQNWDRAITAYRRAIELDSEQPGWVYEKLGEALSYQTNPEKQAQLEQAEKELIEQHPLPHKIFLPTEKMPLEDRVKGLKKVIDVYGKWQEVYQPQLKQLQEKYRGRDRCFIIGNGPSINQTALELLKDEVTFGVNGIFLKSEETGFVPTFYVVEDHLVAEDRQQAINDFKEPTKLFPINLAYCLDEAEDTIFYDHRPRKSYPDGYDFSTDASEHTYTGCTVTFSCMQLAYSLGFKNIYLIGVDCSYDIPEDVKVDHEYQTETLDMDSDDTNHFHPDYFGKGYRWHDPQVHKMKEAYREARRVCNETGVNMYNATIGGKLEVFPRADYYSLFDTNQMFPRLLIIDLTRMGSISATGQVKQNLFAGWSPGNLLQIYCAGEEIKLYSPADFISDLEPDRSAIFNECKRFNPQLIYYRPVADKPFFHSFASELIEQLKVPVVSHLMDDWPQRLLRENPSLGTKFAQSLSTLLTQSAARLSISQAMSDAFQARYDLDFTPIANCINPEEWQQEPRTAAGNFKLRYVGSLADDMTFSSIQDIVEVVGELSQQLPLELEIYTSAVWKPKAIASFADIPHVKIIEAKFSQVEYRQILSDADGLIIAYNFDAQSINYVQYSMANKLPECLAAGAPLLVYGPQAVATVAYAAQTDAVQLVDQRDREILRSAIQELVQNSELSLKLAARARQFAFEHHNSAKIRHQFYTILRQAAANGTAVTSLTSSAQSISLVAGFIRDDHAHIDETDLVFEFFRDSPADSIMIDVGAHHGTALKSFAEKGWQVFGFEPDPANRAILMKNIKHQDNVTIDVRAVSDRIMEGIPFFTSDESTGVSTLKPFLDSHETNCTVSTTTLTDVCRDRQIEKINFLKIDTEGHDLFVLKGVPWDKVQPEVIECEFEDSKTVPLGYTFHDLCRYLTDKGYTVIVSEWHPIIRYGIKHDWYRLTSYPCELNSSKAWGNIVAFKTEPDFSQVIELAKRVLKTEASGAPTAKSYIKKGKELEQQQKIAEAIVEYQQAVQIEPDKPELHYKIGELLSKQKRLSEAADHYKLAVELRQDYMWAWRGLGDIYLIQNELDLALTAFQRVTEIDPTYFHAQHRLGDVYKKQRDFTQAIAAYRKALELKPGSTATEKALAECLNKQNK